MLFNKKPEEEVMSDFSTIKRPSAVGISAMESAAISRKANGAPTRSVIDAWLMITGNLQSEGEVQVDGQINGDAPTPDHDPIMADIHAAQPPSLRTTRQS